MEHNHAVVWIDHSQARVFHFNQEEVETLVLHPKNPHIHIHHKANEIGSGHAPEDMNYFKKVVEAIGSSKAVLLTGPGIAKTALMKFIALHVPTMLPVISGVETVDHPTDGTLVAHARAYFHSADRMTDQKL